MKDSAFIRATDNLGRLVIPKEVRDSLGILPGEPVSMTFKDGKVIIEKHKDACFLCGKTGGEFYKIHDKLVCNDCRDLLNKT